MADGSRRTFKDGYIGALTCRTSWANAVLSKMGSVNLADLSGLGTEVSGGLDGGGFGDTGGAFTYDMFTPEQLASLLQYTSLSLPLSSCRAQDIDALLLHTATATSSVSHHSSRNQQQM